VDGKTFGENKKLVEKTQRKYVLQTMIWKAYGYKAEEFYRFLRTGSKGSSDGSDNS